VLKVVESCSWHFLFTCPDLAVGLMYRLTTIHFVTKRQTDDQTDKRHYDDNSWSFCVAVDSANKTKIGNGVTGINCSNKHFNYRYKLQHKADVNKPQKAHDWNIREAT